MVHDNLDGNQGRNCEGFMLTGNNPRVLDRPEQWSTCSQNEFARWFRKKGKTCTKIGCKYSIAMQFIYVK